MNKPKICLIYPQHPGSIQEKIDPPMGVLSIATVIRLNGYDVTVVDLIGETEYRIPEADIYGISVCTPSVEETKKVARVCKSINAKAKIVVGGIHIAALPNEKMADVDAYVLGPGEQSFLNIIRDYPYLRESYTDRSIYKTLPIIDRSFVNLDDYKRTVDGQRSLSMQTSRGCPFACSFCSEHLLNHCVEYAPETLVQEEIRSYSKLGYGGFFIYDDIFTMNKRRLAPILAAFKETNSIFDFHARVGSTTREDLELIQQCGGNLCRIGTESFSSEILLGMNKRVTVQENIDFVKMVKDVGLTCRCFIIFGFPGENERTVDETLEGIERANPDQIMMATFIPYPGTDVFKNPGKYKIFNIDKDYSKYNLSNDDGLGEIIFESEVTPKETLYRLQKKLYDYIYTREMKGSLPFYQQKLLKTT